MFNLHDFVLTTILKMIGNVQEYQVREYSLGWYTKNILTDEDMIKIEETLQPKEEVAETVEEVVEEITEPTEEVTEETKIIEESTEVQATEENIEEV